MHRFELIGAARVGHREAHTDRLWHTCQQGNFTQHGERAEDVLHRIEAQIATIGESELGVTPHINETQVTALMQQLDVTDGYRTGALERRRLDNQAAPGAELCQPETVADMGPRKLFAHHLTELMAERKTMLAQHPTSEELRRRDLGAPKNFERMNAAIAQIFGDMEQGRRIVSVTLTQNRLSAVLAPNGKICGAW